MNHATHNVIVGFIWNIADDVLRDVYVRGKYRDVILPMTVIRRLDCLLERTKEEVLTRYEFLEKAGIHNQAPQLTKASSYPFYNTSRFTLRRLLDEPSQIRANFENYLNGFSNNVQEIIAKFKFRNQLETLEESNRLYGLIEKFLSKDINLSSEPLITPDGRIVHEGLTNHGMGYVFEELSRKFNEENNEEAGEHFTPRDIIQLMVNLIFLPIKDQIESGTYLINVPMKPSGIEWLGEIPAHWNIESIGRLSESLQTGPFGSQLHSHEYSPNGIPVINPSNMKDLRIVPDSNCAVDQQT